MRLRLGSAVLAAGLAVQLGCSNTEAPGTTTPATGALSLAVDAREVDRKLFHARETIPVNPGPLTLVYPKWLPGEHGPTGPITDLVGLKFSAAGRPLNWLRDTVDMYAFHLDVPVGVQAVEATFDFISAASTSGFSSAASVTPHLAVITWNQVVLYPQGARTDDVKVEASLALPAGWKYATALRPAGPPNGPAASEPAAPGWVKFGPVTLTTLVDSPVLAGEFLLPISLDATSRPVEIDVAADSPASLEISPELTGKLKRLVAEADAMFGARHYDRYHFLLSLSDHVAHFGLEHHESNDSRVYEKALLDQSPNLGVLAHEYVHSWNGKYRRPAGLATSDFQAPMQGELLWVYEGLTQYLGYVLAARSGLWSDQYYKERLAQVAAYLDNQPGRDWRPLVDTTISAQLLYGAPGGWSALRRGTDFYDEGWLIWLDADTLIRQLSAGKQSLDDFCRRFHGGTAGPPALKPYGLEDIVAALNDVAPYDWKTFLTSRVNRTGGRAPLDGVARGGWQLIYSDDPNDYLRLTESGELKRTEAGYSIGLRIKDDGSVIDAVPASPAYKAGVGPGMKILSVSGKKWSPDVLRASLAASAANKALPIAMTIENLSVTKDVAIDYHGGLREPHLERTPSPDVLGQILSPRVKK